MRSTYNARDNLRSSRAYPAEFGARHPIVYTPEVSYFFGDLGSAWNSIIPEHEVADNYARPHLKQQFRVFEDPERVGVTVLEKRLTAAQARRKRIYWNPNDVGRIQGRLENQIAHLGFPDGGIEAQLTQIIRVGDADRRTGGRKLAAIVDQESRQAELLVSEHELIVQWLGKNLESFTYPYNDYVPKVTLGRIFKEVPPEKLDACVTAAQALLPITVQIDPVVFFAQQQVHP